MNKKLLSINFKNLKMLAFSAALFGFSTANAQYCVPEINCTDGDLILNVEFAGIENPSNCSPNGYGDYTVDVDPAEVETGQTYVMAAEVGAGWTFETVGVWIDFDDSESFEASEFFLIGTGSGSIVEGDIEIPADANSGIFRMRVSVLASDVPIEDPCLIEPTNFGEFEDYLININSTVGTPDFDFTNSVTTFKTGDVLNISAGTSIDKVEVYDLTGKLIASQQNIASRTAAISLSAFNQVLLVKVQSEEGYTVTKKVVF
jgi:hypothetical protein